MRRLILVLLLSIATAAPASAQQSFSFHLGGFSPRSADARILTTGHHQTTSS